MNSADQQQRGDAHALLPIAVREREEYVKLYTRLQNNITQFVDRSNYELAALALVIRQKDENIATLQKMAEGYFVAPTPPVTAAPAPAATAPAEAAPPEKEEPKKPARRANGTPPVVVTKVELEPEAPKP